MPRLSRAALVVAAVGWLLLAAGSLMWTVSSGRDAASAVLAVPALLLAAIAAYCLGRAVDARGRRVALLWAGRALALAGAVWALSFPTVLYGELAMLARQGRAPTYDIAAALWHELRVLPLGLLPALVALRWGRLAGLLLLLLTAYGAADSLVHFGGMTYYPESRISGPADLVAINAPAVLTAALLLLGGTRWRGDEPALSRSTAAQRAAEPGRERA